jgi:ATP-binding cassette subfamily B protein
MMQTALRATSAIFLDDVPTQSLSLQDLRDRVGIVPQDAVIFSTSALENIRYGRNRMPPMPK